MRQELGRETYFVRGMSRRPVHRGAQELKTKPTQHSVKELLSMRNSARHFALAGPIVSSRKISSRRLPCFANVGEEAVITAKDVASVYEVPLVFANEGVDTLILKYLHLEARDRDLSKWADIVHRVYNPKDTVTIGIVGKYVEYEDSYKSLKEALVHGALASQSEATGELDWRPEGLEAGDETWRAQLEGLRMNSRAWWIWPNAASKGC